MIAWESFAQDNVFTSGIYAQRYDAAGRQMGGEFGVNTFVDTDQVAPAVAALNNGDFVVAWQSIDQDGSQNGIYGQRYDAAGAPLGAEFRANTFANDEQIEPCGGRAGEWRVRSGMVVGESGQCWQQLRHLRASLRMPTVRLRVQSCWSIALRPAFNRPPR